MPPLARNPRLLVLLVLFAGGFAYFGLDYLNGGIERVTTVEAQACIRETGATVTDTDSDLDLTNRGGGDAVYGTSRAGGRDHAFAVLVLDGREDAPTAGWDDPRVTHVLVGNTAIVWGPAGQPARLDQLAGCLREQHKDA